MNEIGNFKNYKCAHCNGKKSRYWKTFGNHIYRHFNFIHDGDQIKLIKRYSK